MTALAMVQQQKWSKEEAPMAAKKLGRYQRGRLQESTEAAAEETMMMVLRCRAVMAPMMVWRQ